MKSDGDQVFKTNTVVTVSPPLIWRKTCNGPILLELKSCGGETGDLDSFQRSTTSVLLKGFTSAITGTRKGDLILSCETR